MPESEVIDTTALAPATPPTPTTLARPNEPDMGQLLSAIAQGGVTAGNVEALERIAAVWERQEERMARRDFDEALAALQAECQIVQPNRQIPDNNGNLRSEFADYVGIWKQVGPLIAKHRFSISWDTERLSEPARIVVSCILSRGGHSRVTKFAARISAPPKSSDAQADGATNSIAKRYALCNALNIVVGYDDARAEGDTISPEAAQQLEQAAREVYTTDAEITKFLEFLGAPTFAQVTDAKLDVGMDHLNRRRLQRRPTGSTTNPGKPCPCDPANHGEWIEAMAVEMSARWQCPLGDADKVLREIVAHANKAGPLTPERRAAAWDALNAGRFDDRKPAASGLFPRTTHPDAGGAR